MTRIRKVGSSLLAVALAVLAIHAARNEIVSPDWSIAGHLDWLIFVFWALLVSGILLWVISFLPNPGEILIRLSWANDLRVLRCNSADLKDINELSTKAFGIAASNLGQIERLHAMSADIFWKVYNKRDKCTVGYFCVFKLSKKGVDSIKDDTFYAPSPSPETLIVSNRTGCPVYVGAIYGEGYRAKGFALAGLQMYLQQIKPSAIYAKAATEDGLRLLTKNGFSPVTEGQDQVGSYFVRNAA